MKILKIGGSIITDKNQPMTARTEEIERVAEEIAAYPCDLILVHGAGSFGHMPAKKYGLPENFSREGVRVTHQSVVMLNDMVIEALTEAGADPIPVHPLSCITLKDGRINSFALAPVKEMVRDGFLPVLHGDVAMDVSRKAGIISGDQIVPYLACVLEADTVAVGSNVDGVIFQGRHLEKITRKDLSILGSDLGGSAGVDVTGGMKGKLMELLDLADKGISSTIFNASKEGNISRALRGEAVGTEVGRPE